MILDTSCIIAILADEPDADRYIQAISHSPRCRISAGTFIELSIVLESQFPPEVARQCEALFRSAKIEIEPVTVDQAFLARQAFHNFGKGKHKARLNFGDCFGYALSKESGEPLLFQGHDFSKTDVLSAL
jgi:ribonuclease VapC